MKAMNVERSDGKTLRGECPADKWSGERVEMRQIPDSAKWMYRSAYNVREVTRNGVRVTIGTGKFQQSYTYANPEKLENFRGSRVVIWWNDYDPDTDAVIYSVKNGRPDKFICVASRVQNPDRIGASDSEMHAEATRKKLAQGLAVTQSRSLSPWLTRGNVRAGRTQRTAGPDANADIAERIAAARAATQEKREAEAERRAAVRRVELQAEDRAAALNVEPQESREQMSSEEIASLFAAEEHEGTEA